MSDYQATLLAVTVIAVAAILVLGRLCALSIERAWEFRRKDQ